MLDSPADGAWNMAVDEVLLATAAETGQLTLRLYEWSQPTLSLGYFQAYEDRQQHAASRKCAVVRRMTGGGAILHDREVTYSLGWSAQGQPGRRPDFAWLYDAVHDALRAELAGHDVILQPANGQVAGRDPRAFLCFQRLSPQDLVLDQAKIVGSAQRRRKSAVLQHGSLLLQTSSCAPELPGLRQLQSKVVDIRLLQQSWPARLAARLGLEMVPASLTDDELRQAGELMRIKYARPAWSRRR
ncbi:MAG: lipoate--protein ligase family protein [Planctomycetales bacterium]|nr:lipoate--protein ligase family protein [Planctomycetales bacterium]NIO34279.1 lipoate--protein ligase family protein [Planctomycetales bacterium]NIO46078.1 lipoate--protein ligase family protein [Planctomycetales bacterium]NIP04148.1 lipoate--protein ligase family protein [Planctomycetales bacterium]NIP68920.1 lipoate--protein ligase family protein [Planctomycetales bacterium]